jgi:hypothetical protein
MVQVTDDADAIEQMQSIGGERQMSKYRNTLLATAAAVAFVASAGLATAQEPSKSQTPGATPRATQNEPKAQRPNAAPPSSAAQERPSGGQPTTAQEQRRPGGTGAQQKPSNTPATAQEQQRPGGTGAQQKPSNTPSTAQQKPDRGSPSTAQRQSPRNEPNGLQGNAAGTKVQLSEQQRSDLRRTVINGSGAPRAGHVDFDVTVGTVVPRDRIQFVPVPDTLVQMEPSWRGFLYFVYEDDIVVVDPNTMQIVAVLLV